mmetsp:Transcript_15953/g.47985  ORF Transcript_15953/g.47985 Transcript_15953/m.47985 type:complete len:229 (+) Transcript_15953:337-1023(+)
MLNAWRHPDAERPVPPHRLDDGPATPPQAACQRRVGLRAMQQSPCVLTYAGRHRAGLLAASPCSSLELSISLQHSSLLACSQAGRGRRRLRAVQHLLRQLRTDAPACSLARRVVAATATAARHALLGGLLIGDGRRRQRPAVGPVEAVASGAEAERGEEEHEGVPSEDDREELHAVEPVDEAVVQHEHDGDRDQRQHLGARLVLEADDGGKDRVFEGAHQPVDPDRHA